MSSNINGTLLANGTAASANETNWLLTFLAAKTILSFATMSSSASMVYVTWKTKTLRETFNILIAAKSLCCFCYMFTFGIQFIILASGHNFLLIQSCFFIMAFPLFAMESQFLLYMALAFDRLLVALFPFWHLVWIKAHSRRYLAFLGAIICAHGLFVLFSSFKFSFLDNPNALVGCSTLDALPAYQVQIPIYLNFTSLLFYIALFAVVKIRNKSPTSANTASHLQSTRRILMSISAAFLCEFFGWFFNRLAFAVLFYAFPWMNASQQWFIMSGLGILLVPAMGLDAICLYMMSADYRAAFQQTFGFEFPSIRIVQT